MTAEIIQAAEKERCCLAGVRSGTQVSYTDVFHIKRFTALWLAVVISLLASEAAAGSSYKPTQVDFGTYALIFMEVKVEKILS